MFVSPKCLLCMSRRTFWSPMPVFAIVLIVGIPAGALYAGNSLNILSKLWQYILCFSPLAPIYYLLRSIWISPSVSEKAWEDFLTKNPDAKKHLRFCGKCANYRPYRASHCSSCNICVLRRDHHCPWINNCVSFFNHYYFIMFLVTTILGLLVNSLFLYKSLQKMKDAEKMGLDKSEIAHIMMVIMMSGSMAVSMLFAVPAILFQQIQAVVTNQAGCESWELDRINDHFTQKKLTKVKNPFNIDLSTNFKQILHAQNHDGIVFPCLKGHSNASYAKWGKSIDMSIYKALTDSSNVSVTKRAYDGAVRIADDFWATLTYPWFDNVLKFEQGEVLYNTQNRFPKSGWITVHKIVRDGESVGYVRGLVPRVYIKTAMD